MELTGRIWRGVYVDSIALMQVAEAVRRVPGVTSVALLMATPANRSELEAVEMWPEGFDGADVNDLVLAVRSEGADASRAALERAEELLTRPSRPRGDAQVTERPRSITSAARAWPDANLAVISVPGSQALNEAQQALSGGLHVFLFSDGVPLADEIALKRRARDLGLLVMGPECGTSILGGVGVGFANAVRQGSIGLVGASGTGLQEVTVLIDRLGGGVSHAIGTGGRDLDEAVDGITTRQALRCLAEDEATRVIVLISKPPSARVAGAVLAAAAASGKPVVACLLGWNGTIPPGVRAVDTLHEAAEAAVNAAGGSAPKLEVPPFSGRSRRAGGQVRGFFTGGTLCEEARRLVGDGGHRFTDFGSAEYTRGRPHPVIDPERRSEAVAAAGDDRDASVLLVDVVLGYAAHPDPARPLTQAILEARARAARRGGALDVVARIVGAEGDPQGLSDQEAKLRSAGAILCPSNRLAAGVARELVTGDAR